MAFPRAAAVALSVLTVACALFALTNAAFADQVVVVEGDEEVVYATRCTIVELNQQKIIWEVDEKNDGRPRTKNADWDDVIVWAVDPNQRPREYVRAMDAKNGLNLVEAIAQFAEVVKQANAAARGFDQLLKHLAYYYSIQCGIAMNTRDGARTAIDCGEKLRKEFSNSYFMPEVLESLGIAYERNGQGDKAIQSYQALKNTANGQARGALRLGFVYFNRSEFGKAQQEFDTASRAADTTTAQTAMLYLAKCAVANPSTGDWARARGVCETLVNDAEDRAVLGAAYLIMGLADAKSGKWRDAFMSLAKTATAYKQDVRPEELKDALRYSIRCADELAKNDEKWVARKDLLGRRYQELYRATPDTTLPWE